jgi:hypothetical protein
MYTFSDHDLYIGCILAVVSLPAVRALLRTILAYANLFGPEHVARARANVWRMIALPELVVDGGDTGCAAAGRQAWFRTTIAVSVAGPTHATKIVMRDALDLRTPHRPAGILFRGEKRYTRPAFWGRHWRPYFKHASPTT